MDTINLKMWAEVNGEGPVDNKPDSVLGLTSRLLRFRWNNGMAVGVGCNEPTKVHINAVLDGLSWFMAKAEPADTTLHLVLGASSPSSKLDVLQESLGAIGTLVAGLRSGPEIRVWSITPGSQPEEITAEPSDFTTSAPRRWSKMLMDAAETPVSGMAAELVEVVSHPSFALYPKLTDIKTAKPWQIRLDGLEVGRTGPTVTTLGLATRNYDAAREPRDTWRKVVGPHSFPSAELAMVVSVINLLIEAWTEPGNPDAVLNHGQSEHGLEAHILSGRLQLTTTNGPLRLAVPVDSRAIRAAQFPTLWGDVSRPRYLDALLADADGHAWAVELKDQYAGGGHGSYLRDGIAQAVLYRHFIQSASALEPWFARYSIRRESCRAALAFPTAATAASTRIASLRDLAARYDVEIIEFVRPGA